MTKGELTYLKCNFSYPNDRKIFARKPGYLSIKWYFSFRKRIKYANKGLVLKESGTKLAFLNGSNSSINGLFLEGFLPLFYPVRQALKRQKGALCRAPFRV